jgi:hypothetical protein
MSKFGKNLSRLLIEGRRKKGAPRRSKQRGEAALNMQKEPPPVADEDIKPVKDEGEPEPEPKKKRTSHPSAQYTERDIEGDEIRSTDTEEEKAAELGRKPELVTPDPVAKATEAEPYEPRVVSREDAFLEHLRDTGNLVPVSPDRLADLDVEVPPDSKMYKLNMTPGDRTEKYYALVSINNKFLRDMDSGKIKKLAPKTLQKYFKFEDKRRLPSLIPGDIIAFPDPNNPLFPTTPVRVRGMTPDQKERGMENRVEKYKKQFGKFVKDEVVRERKKIRDEAAEKGETSPVLPSIPNIADWVTFEQYLAKKKAQLEKKGKDPQRGLDKATKRWEKAFRKAALERYKFASRDELVPQENFTEEMEEIEKEVMDPRAGVKRKIMVPNPNFGEKWDWIGTGNMTFYFNDIAEGGIKKRAVFGKKAPPAPWMKKDPANPDREDSIETIFLGLGGKPLRTQQFALLYPAKAELVGDDVEEKYARKRSGEPFEVKTGQKAVPMGDTEESYGAEEPDKVRILDVSEMPIPPDEGSKKKKFRHFITYECQKCGKTYRKGVTAEQAEQAELQLGEEVEGSCPTCVRKKGLPRAEPDPKPEPPGEEAAPSYWEEPTEPPEKDKPQKIGFAGDEDIRSSEQAFPGKPKEKKGPKDIARLMDDDEPGDEENE